MSVDFKMLAKTFYGFEDILEKELVGLGAKNVIKGNRIVSFEGDKGFLYKANLSLRTALKILKPIYKCKIINENKLYNVFYEFPWEKYMNISSKFMIESVVQGTIFNHSQYASQKAKDGLVDRFRKKYNKRPNVDTTFPDIKINLHIQNNSCSISLDSSGESLHKRGYRASTNIAPINEVLAAGLINLSDWEARNDFLDPMCGSGTFLIEAAMLACKIPANINRKSFSFEKWNDFDASLYKLIVDSQLNKIITPKITIKGSDKAPSAIKKTKENIKNAKLDNFIKVDQTDFFKIKKGNKNDLHLLTNPPYGHRLKGDIKYLYKSIGDNLKIGFPNTDAWLITSNLEASKFVGLRPSKKIKVFNGKLESRLLHFRIYEGSKKVHKFK